MISESDKERFNARIGGEVLVWDYLDNDKGIVEIGADVKITESSLCERLSEYALHHGEDFQSMFKTERCFYLSCFIRNVSGFKKEFCSEGVLSSLFNHSKGTTAEYLISFPEKMNYDGKDVIKASFINIIQKHVVTLDKCQWGDFVQKASEGRAVSTQFEHCRANILNQTREKFVKNNLLDSFEPDFYVERLCKSAVKIGKVGGHSVWFNPNGFYFYWNKETEYLLESWLTFPAHPYGW